MQRKSRVFILATFFGVLILCRPAWVAAAGEPKVGQNIGDVAFSAPLTAEEATYLGLPQPQAFSLKDIQAPYVLIESLHST